jgi:hypothetical protein
MLAGQRVLITKFDHDPSRAVGSARHKHRDFTPPVPETFAMVDGRRDGGMVGAIRARFSALVRV